MRVLILAAGFALLSASGALAQSDNPVDSTDDVFLLVQSELEHLKVAEERINIDFKGVSPKAALEQLGKKARLAIEVQGVLPRAPRLKASFRDATVREVLEWFAREVAVSYRAEHPDKLLVLPAAEVDPPGPR